MSDDRRPLERPLRLKSKNKWMEDKEFPADAQGTKKLLRDCTQAEKRFIAESGWENIFAREQPRNIKAEHWKWERMRPDIEEALQAVDLDDRRDELDGKLRHIQQADWIDHESGESGTALVNLAVAMASHGDTLNINTLSDADVETLIGLCDKLLAAHGRSWQEAGDEQQ
jgi:hypothetical protein